MADVLASLIKESSKNCIGQSFSFTGPLHQVDLDDIEEFNKFFTERLAEHENNTTNYEDTVLHRLFAEATNLYKIQVINHVISCYKTLESRPEILAIIISQSPLSYSIPQKTFDLLAEKGLPKPNDRQMSELSRRSKCKSDFDSTRLAFSFLNYRQDPSLLQKINNYSAIHDAFEERRCLKNLLGGRITSSNPTDFHKPVCDLVLINDDALLQKALEKKTIKGFLNDSVDHSPALNLASEHKFTETFKILIKAGFDPLKHREGAANCFAAACETQSKGTLEPYLKSIREKFGSEAVTKILCEGETALSHAINGRAYISTINFLLDSGAPVEERLSENLQSAARLGHARAFELLLERGSLESEQLEEVFNVVKDEGDYVIASIFAEYLKNARDDSQSQKTQALKPALEEKKSDLTHQDLFRICQLNGERTLQYYLEARPEYVLQDHINKTDAEGKTALYYAINDNAYNGLVNFLLNHGANPNQIAVESQLENSEVAVRSSVAVTHLDAATLAIRNCEPATLVLLLNSRKLNSVSILAAAAELIKPENNEIVLTEAFVNHVDAGEIRQLPLPVQQIMLQRSLESDRGSCIYKMRDSARGGDLESFVENLFYKSIEEGNVKVVAAMIEKLEVKKMFLNQAGRAKDQPESSERDSLLSASSVNGYGASEEAAPKTIFKIPTSSAEKLSAKQVDAKYADKAFDLAKSGDEEESRRGKEMFIKIVGAGFPTSKSEREIKALKIDDGRGGAWCPAICCPSVCVVS